MKKRLSLHTSFAAYFLLPPLGWDANPSHVYLAELNSLVPFIHLGGERHCESKVSCPRTQRSAPARA